MKKSKIARALLFVLLILSVAAAVWQILVLNMLPTKYLAALFGGIALLVLIAAFFVFKKGKDNKLTKVRRGFGYFLIVVVMVLCILLTYFVGRLNQTVSSITSDTQTSNVIGVYVLKDNKAQNIMDAEKYNFAITEQFDYDNTKLAMEDINSKVGSDITTTTYDHVDGMIDALYREDVDALIINQSYISLLEEQEKYSLFETDTRCIYTFEIIEEAPEEESETEEELSVTEKPFIVYISGNDTLTKKLQTSRSDVNILAVVNPQTKQILLLNTPRDAYVETTQSKNHSKDKLTHCGLYGIDCSISTLENFYDIEVDYYAQINFTGFEKLVDDLDGITVTCEKSFTSADGFHYSKGENYLDGEEALSFVRERDAFGDGDYQRGRDQMIAIEAILDKARTSPAVLQNYGDILTDLEGMFITDMSSDDMSALVKMQIDDNVDWTITSYGIWGEGKSKTTFSVPNQRAYVMIPNDETVEFAQKLIQMTIDGEPITDEVMAEAPVEY